MSKVLTDICNGALIKLGAEPIQSLDDNNKQGRLLRLRYERIRNVVLRAHGWTFALRRIVLTPIADPELEFGETNVFNMPVDCLKVWRVNGGRCKYSIEGRTILSDEGHLEVLYVSSATPVDHFDDIATEAMSCLLAWDLCYSLTQSTSLKAEILNEYNFWLDQARSFNSQEQTPENFQFNSYLNSRIIGDME